MSFAKLLNGYPFFAPNPVLAEGNYVGNPSAAVYLQQGYKPVVFTDRPQAPEEGFVWAEVWTETESEIVLSWTLRAASEDEELSAEDLVSVLLGGDGA